MSSFLPFISSSLKCESSYSLYLSPILFLSPPYPPLIPFHFNLQVGRPLEVQANRGDTTLFSVSAPTTNSAMLFTVTSLDDVDQDLFVKVRCRAEQCCRALYSIVKCSSAQCCIVHKSAV